MESTSEDCNLAGLVIKRISVAAIPDIADEVSVRPWEARITLLPAQFWEGRTTIRNLKKVSDIQTYPQTAMNRIQPSINGQAPFVDQWHGLLLYGIWKSQDCRLCSSLSPCAALIWRLSNGCTSNSNDPTDA